MRQKYHIKTQWLGFPLAKPVKVIADCYLEGRIYEDDSNGIVIRTKATSRKQDLGWFVKMMSKRVGTADIYHLQKRFNSSWYPELEFNAAPGSLLSK